MAFFLMDKNSTKGRDPNINIINGIYHIKGKKIGQHLSFQLYKQAYNFPQRRVCWLLELTLIDDKTIDQSEAHSTNSVTLQKMMAEQIKLETFDPPHHKLKTNTQNKLDALLKEFETQFVKDEKDKNDSQHW